MEATTSATAQGRSRNERRISARRKAAGTEVGQARAAELTARRIPTRAMALCLVLVAGLAAGVAQAATPKFPDTDLVLMKTTGAELTNSLVYWNSATSYYRTYDVQDRLNDKRCVAVYESRTYSNGTVEPMTHLKTACDNQVGLLRMQVTTPTNIKSMKVRLCRLTTAGKPDNCVTKTVVPGLD